jgi:hypothetical protein
VIAAWKFLHTSQGIKIDLSYHPHCIPIEQFEMAKGDNSKRRNNEKTIYSHPYNRMKWPSDLGPTYSDVPDGAH